MKKIILLFMIFGQYTYAGSDMIGNGGGLAESNFIYAYNKLPSIIKDCLNSSLCSANQGKNRSLLKQMYKQLSSQEINSADIVFISEKQNPGFFIIDGQEKIAKTYSFLASPIYINLDQIYTTNAEGIPTPSLSIPGMLRLLVHEQGHRHNIKHHEGDGNLLDQLGAQIQAYMEQDRKTLTQNLNQSDLKIEIFNLPSPIEKAYVHLTIDGESYDLQSKVDQSLSCSNQREKTGFQISNSHWGSQATQISSFWGTEFNAWVVLHCYDSNDDIYYPEKYKLSGSLFFDSMISASNRELFLFNDSKSSFHKEKL